MQFKLSLLAAQIAEALYTARLLQTSTDQAVLAVSFSALPMGLRTIYLEAAEVAIRRMDPYVFAAACLNARRLAPAFETALEVYHRTLTLGPRAEAPAPPVSPLPPPAAESAASAVPSALSQESHS